MTKVGIGLALLLATGAVSSLTLPPARAQSRTEQSTNGLYRNLDDLGDAQLRMQYGNAQVEADENARQRALALPEQTATAPGLQSDDRAREDENLNAGEPLLFDDHKDVRHDTEDLDRDR